MSLKHKNLLSLAPLSVEDIQLILETADSFKEVSGREIKKVPALRGRTVVNLFFEPSTRTRTSFELAAKRLSADVINFSPSSSSVVKGETLLDTARNIEAMQAHIIVLRHSSAGAAETLARGVKSSVINAGDGWHEHPTRASEVARRRDDRVSRAFRKAVSADFRNHSPLVTDLFESGAVVARSRYIQAMLGEWMKPSPRELNPHVHGTSTAWVVKQAKGVVGNIAPWNFPIECALIMVADMLAAGNRVIVKTSELAPNTAEVVREAIAKHLPEDVLAVTCGGVELAQYFAGLPWAHLTYTGSTRVGRLVMQAAARNLTPVTLEMGGKNPTVFAEDGFEDTLIERFLFCRVFKGGQVCTSPDYALVPEHRLDAFQ